MSELKISIIVQIVGVVTTTVLTLYLPAFYRAIKAFIKSVDEFKTLLQDYPKFKESVKNEHDILHSKIDALNNRLILVEKNFENINKAIRKLFIKLKIRKIDENID